MAGRAGDTAILFLEDATAATMNPAEPVRDQAQEGIDARFDRIMREYGPAISRVAFGYERLSGAREELIQEIALAVWQALPRFREECSERTLVFRIAHNRGLTHVYRRAPAQSSLDELTVDPVDPLPHPEQKLAMSAERDRLRAAVRRLPLPYRKVIILALEELSHAQIAEVLGISESNVGVRVSRAKAQLKKILEASS